MRPAVHASILRNRGPRRQSRRKRHTFSAKRLLIMVFCGIILFVPGLVLTIVGLEHSEGDYQTLGETQRIFYQAVGPSMCTIGAVVMFASCIYFYCYGTGPQTSAAAHQPQPAGDHEQDEKGSSIRSKRDHGHHHHHLFHHHRHQQHPNGRAVEVHSPDGECRHSLRSEDGAGPSPNPKAFIPTVEEEVPLAKMEDSSDLTTKGQQLSVPVILINIQEPSDSEDMDFADDISMDKQSIYSKGVKT